MSIDTLAFFDELLKIAEVQSENPVENSPPRENIVKGTFGRALKAGLLAAGGTGLGWGLGHLISSTILPTALQKFVPNPTAEQLAKAMLIVGSLGSLGHLATQYRNAEAMDYIRRGDKKSQDMLMRHEELNPEPYKGQST
jgi:hypothetical protein